jgi:hypothetical protein
MDRFQMPTPYDEMCQVCKGADCEPAELDGCNWDAVCKGEV